MGEDEVQVEKSTMEMAHESQELLVPSDLQPSELLQLDEGHEVNAITVLTLLDQLVKMLDSVAEKQQQMDEWQSVMEGSVRHIQNDMNKLVKSNSVTSNSVSKLLEKNRKISAIMKDVRDKMDRQTSQVKKLEENHNLLLHRDNFRVLLFQDQNEIPSSVFVKDPIREVENESLSPDTNHSQEEVELHIVQLSSDEDLDDEPEDEEEFVEMMEPLEKSRAEKIKRSSLKKVDSLKKAFSRENFEKKMNKIVSVEKRDKIKKSLSQKKGGSFKLFHVKKNREGEEHAEHESFSEIHADLAPPQDEEPEELAKERMGGAKEKEEVEEVKEEEEENESLDDGVEGLRAEYALSDTLPQDTSHMSHNALHREEEEEEEQREREEGDEEESTAVERSS